MKLYIVLPWLALILAILGLLIYMMGTTARAMSFPAPTTDNTLFEDVCPINTEFGDKSIIFCVFHTR